MGIPERLKNACTREAKEHREGVRCTAGVSGILKLLVEVGEACALYQDRVMNTFRARAPSATTTEFQTRYVGRPPISGRSRFWFDVCFSAVGVSLFRRSVMHVRPTAWSGAFLLPSQGRPKAVTLSRQPRLLPQVLASPAPLTSAARRMRPLAARIWLDPVSLLAHSS